MKKFIVLYTASQDAQQQTANMKPEDQAKGMEMWMQWAAGCGDKLIDLGAPLMNGQQLNSDGKSTGSKLNIAGYSILEAENMEDAKALMKNHPHLGWNADCTIEVHETMPLPGM